MATSLSPPERSSSAHPLLTEREVAAMFQVTPRTVRRWAHAGELPCVRLGGVTRYPLLGIEALIRPGPERDGRH